MGDGVLFGVNVLVIGDGVLLLGGVLLGVLLVGGALLVGDSVLLVGGTLLVGDGILLVAVDILFSSIIYAIPQWDHPCICKHAHATYHQCMYTNMHHPHSRVCSCYMLSMHVCLPLSLSLG